MANEIFPKYYPQLMAENYTHWQLYRELQAISDAIDGLYTKFAPAYGSLYVDGDASASYSALSKSSAQTIDVFTDPGISNDVRCSTASSALVVSRSGAYYVGAVGGYLSAEVTITSHIIVAVNGTAQDPFYSKFRLGADNTIDMQSGGHLSLTISDKVSLLMWATATISVVWSHLNFHIHRLG